MAVFHRSWDDYIASRVCVQRVRPEDTQRLRRQEQGRQPPDHAVNVPDEQLRTLGRVILEWKLFNSWKHCRFYASVVLEPLHSACFRAESLKLPYVGSCERWVSRYIVPKPEDAPLLPRNLSVTEICALRLITIDDFNRPHSSGLRRHDKITKLRWKIRRVHDDIGAIANAASRNRTRDAHDFLMNNRDSAYKDYTAAHDKALNEGTGNTLLPLMLLTRTWNPRCGLTQIDQRMCATVAGLNTELHHACPSLQN